MKTKKWPPRSQSTEPAQHLEESSVAKIIETWVKWALADSILKCRKCMGVVPKMKAAFRWDTFCPTILKQTFRSTSKFSHQTRRTLLLWTRTVVPLKVKFHKMVKWKRKAFSFCRVISRPNINPKTSTRNRKRRLIKQKSLELVMQITLRRYSCSKEVFSQIVTETLQMRSHLCRNSMNLMIFQKIKMSKINKGKLVRKNNCKEQQLLTNMELLFLPKIQHKPTKSTNLWRYKN